MQGCCRTAGLYPAPGPLQTVGPDARYGRACGLHNASEVRLRPLARNYPYSADAVLNCSFDRIRNCITVNPIRIEPNTQAIETANPYFR